MGAARGGVVGLKRGRLPPRPQGVVERGAAGALGGGLHLPPRFPPMPPAPFPPDGEPPLVFGCVWGVVCGFVWVLPVDGVVVDVVGGVVVVVVVGGGWVWVCVWVCGGGVGLTVGHWIVTRLCRFP